MTEDNHRPKTYNNVEFVSFQRPRTCYPQPHYSRRPKEVKKKNRCLQTRSMSLFNGVKREKLAKLEKEKEILMEELYNREIPSVHRFDEDEDVNQK